GWRPAGGGGRGVLRFGVVAGGFRALPACGEEVVRSKPWSPTSPPVSRPVSGTGWIGTSAHEKPADQPAASLLTVTGLLAPAAVGRDHRTAGTTPYYGEHQEAVSQSGASAARFVGERGEAIGARKARDSGLRTSQHAAKELLGGLVEASEHILEDVAMESYRLPEHRTQVLSLGLLLRATDRAPLTPSPPRETLL